MELASTAVLASNANHRKQAPCRWVCGVNPDISDAQTKTRVSRPRPRCSASAATRNQAPSITSGITDRFSVSTDRKALDCTDANQKGRIDGAIETQNRRTPNAKVPTAQRCQELARKDVFWFLGCMKDRKTGLELEYAVKSIERCKMQADYVQRQPAVHGLDSQSGKCVGFTRKHVVPRS